MNHNNQNTQERFILSKCYSVLPPLTMKIKILILLLITCFKASYSSEFIYRPIEEHIDEATLIIKGKLIDKYVQYENFKRTIENRSKNINISIPKSVYTTFIFEVNEVLKGTFYKKEIEVKMLGGCLPNDGECYDYSFNYDYSLGENAILFLKFYKKHNYFVTTQASETAYSVTKSGFLISKSFGEYDEAELESYLSKKKIVANKKGEIVLNNKTKFITISELTKKIQVNKHD